MGHGSPQDLISNLNSYKNSDILNIYKHRACFAQIMTLIHIRINKDHTRVSFKFQYATSVEFEIKTFLSTSITKCKFKQNLSSCRSTTFPMIRIKSIIGIPHSFFGWSLPCVVPSLESVLRVVYWIGVECHWGEVEL